MHPHPLHAPISPTFSGGGSPSSDHREECGGSRPVCPPLSRDPLKGATSSIGFWGSDCSSSVNREKQPERNLNPELSGTGLQRAGPTPVLSGPCLVDTWMRWPREGGSRKFPEPGGIPGSVEAPLRAGVGFCHSLSSTATTPHPPPPFLFPQPHPLAGRYCSFYLGLGSSGHQRGHHHYHYPCGLLRQEILQLGHPPQSIPCTLSPRGEAENFITRGKATLGGRWGVRARFLGHAVLNSFGSFEGHFFPLPRKNLIRLP